MASETTSKPISVSFYSCVRPLAIVSKFLGAFPLTNTLKYDGKNLGHSWLCLTHLWDLVVCITVIILFMRSCSGLLADPNYDDTTNNGKDISIWLMFTCYFVAIRGTIQFIFLHLYAPYLPKLFEMLEKYQQEIGTAIIKDCTYHWFTKYLSILWTFGILIILEISSIYFFTQLCDDSLFFFIFLVAGLYVFSNLWEQLPMNMFILIIKYLTHRFCEITEELKKIRENFNKDSGKSLEQLRLQYTALKRIISQVQKCYGMQLAMNLLFLLLDTVLQLFFFFCVTSSRNVILLILALYYMIMTFILLAIVNQLERTNEDLLGEIASFELNTASKEQRLQIKCFTIQVAAHPVNFSACGFFFINNALICSLMAAIATYIVMLVQFMPYIESHLMNITLPWTPGS